jgi:hypothetical protein
MSQSKEYRIVGYYESLEDDLPILIGSLEEYKYTANNNVDAYVL